MWSQLPENFNKGNESREKRQTRDQPEEYLEAIITSQTSSIPSLIDQAKATIEKDLDKKVAAKVSYGTSIISGGVGDILGDYILNERDTKGLKGSDDKNVHNVLLGYSFAWNYGLGFGLPFLVGLPSRIVKVSGNVFTESLCEYELCAR